MLSWWECADPTHRHRSFNHNSVFLRTNDTAPFQAGMVFGGCFSSTTITKLNSMQSTAVNWLEHSVCHSASRPPSCMTPDFGGRVWTTGEACYCWPLFAESRLMWRPSEAMLS